MSNQNTPFKDLSTAVQTVVTSADLENYRQPKWAYLEDGQYTSEMYIVFNPLTGDLITDPTYTMDPDVATPLYTLQGDNDRAYTFPDPALGTFNPSPIGYIPPDDMRLYTGGYIGNMPSMYLDATNGWKITTRKYSLMSINYNGQFIMRTSDNVVITSGIGGTNGIVGKNLYYAQYGKNLLTATPNADLDFINNYIQFRLISKGNVLQNSTASTGTVIYAQREFNIATTPPIVLSSSIVTNTGDIMVTDTGATMVTNSAFAADINTLKADNEKMSRELDEIKSLLKNSKKVEKV